MMVVSSSFFGAFEQARACPPWPQRNPCCTTFWLRHLGRKLSTFSHPVLFVEGVLRLYHYECRHLLLAMGQTSWDPPCDVLLQRIEAIDGNRSFNMATDPSTWTSATKARMWWKGRVTFGVNMGYALYTVCLMDE
ncbi:hypothetical protein GJ744_005266 [Endocarpon pusillum]|uniref:Uncharacterized protein n=1 Tax=Endocarpon pusillum TaxID=364733 RepID=A0A8H7DZN4_9EURO|nr:hypothetical protein GJ744_005266 [Endocarpon pusillum]